MMLSTVVLFVAVQVAAANKDAPLNTETLESEISDLANAAISGGNYAALSIGVGYRGDLVFAEGYGLADLENGVKATAETVYRIGSVTKQITSAAILSLCEAGSINLDSPLQDFLPDFHSKSGIQIHHLLNHTSGIKSYTDLEGFMENHVHEPMTHEDLLSFVKDLPLDFDPGTDQRYNNTAYYILGMIIEEITGERYDHHLENNVFPALHMNKTVYDNHFRITPNRARGYSLRESKLVNCRYLHMNIPGGAGALCSTVGDLIRWTDALMGEELISSEWLDLMLSKTILTDGRVVPYGFGLQISTDSDPPCIEHGGGIFGFASHLAHYPKQGLTIAVLSNCDSGSANAIARSVADVAHRAVNRDD